MKCNKNVLLSAALAFFMCPVSSAVCSLFLLCRAWPHGALFPLCTPPSCSKCFLVLEMKLKQSRKPLAWARSAAVCPLAFLKLNQRTQDEIHKPTFTLITGVLTHIVLAQGAAICQTCSFLTTGRRWMGSRCLRVLLPFISYTQPAVIARPPADCLGLCLTIEALSRE